MAAVGNMGELGLHQNGGLLLGGLLGGLVLLREKSEHSAHPACLVSRKVNAHIETQAACQAEASAMHQNVVTQRVPEHLISKARSQPCLKRQGGGNQKAGLEVLTTNLHSTRVL
eukprot:CAMPEP_0179431844 /NCGR_PEP_ID=MMETSP0799-20121207/16632_1 /TAXON_ID=46947 /ORGANISM="Geminigera cryophila, Strain CCMP2564" /LENGTH=113 /DNA_ID=CAMNT_0021208977 /DNA_START=408 /DNA_END=750 /DNA_ORIENTATION=+